MNLEHLGKKQSATERVSTRTLFIMLFSLYMLNLQAQKNQPGYLIPVDSTYTSKTSASDIWTEEEKKTDAHPVLARARILDSDQEASEKAQAELRQRVLTKIQKQRNDLVKKYGSHSDPHVVAFDRDAPSLLRELLSDDSARTSKVKDAPKYVLPEKIKMQQKTQNAKNATPNANIGVQRTNPRGR